METNFQINLSDFSMGPDELDWLLKEWQKDPKPKTINEIARMVLLHHWELQTNFLPFDIRRPYKEKDRIIVRTVEEWIEPAEVVSVAKNAYKDTGDIINVRLLSYHAKLYGKDIKSFVANYQGEDINVSIVKFNIISEKDETEFIPTLLSAISKDKRFVNFHEYWLPVEMLVSDILNRIREVAIIIEKSKAPLSTHQILEQLFPNDKGEGLSMRLEFSLNHFLEIDQDKRFVLIPGEVNKWDIRVETPPKSHWTVTIKPEWLEKGVLLVPQKLSNCIKKTDIVHVLYDQVDELLPYSPNDRLIKGLANYYTTKAIAEWDKVYLQLQGLEPVRLFMNCRWRKRTERLLRRKPDDLRWEHISLRDCIFVVLAKFKTTAHYREIYSEIAVHKDISLGDIIGTLSKYSPSVFAHVCRGKWTLAGWAKQEYPGRESTEEKDKVEISKEVWQIVCRIEENDYVYKLLQRIKTPLSFDEICNRLGEYMRIDVNQLRATGFLKPDKRFRRLDNGEWALEEWFPPQESGPVLKEDSVSILERRSWANKLLLFLKNLVVSVNRYYSHFFSLIFRQ